MNIFDLIEKDHEKVKSLLEEIQESANDKERRNNLLVQIKQELLAHNKAEESLIYEELEKRGYEKLAVKSYEEHKLAEQCLENFREDLSEASFLARVEILTNLISTHIEEEEEETFDMLEEEFSEDELDNLGKKFQQERENKK